MQNGIRQQSSSLDMVRYVTTKLPRFNLQTRYHKARYADSRKVAYHGASVRAHVRAFIRGGRVKLAPHLEQLRFVLPCCENDLGHFAHGDGIMTFRILSGRSPTVSNRSPIDEKYSRVIVDPFGSFPRSEI